VAVRGAILLILLVGTDLSAADSVEPTSFHKEVVPLLSRLGCNDGSCHGAVQGKKGFRLSLFGGDPAMDLNEILRGENGRRINKISVDDSLLLKKALGQLGHGGGAVTSVESGAFKILRNWLASGAAADDPVASQVVELKVKPDRQTSKVDGEFALQVEATFADGTTRDVTHLCSFESRGPAVASVDRDGRVRAIGIGDAVVVARFGIEPAMSMLEVPQTSSPAIDKLFAAAKPTNRIDKFVLAKLRRLSIPPSEVADDLTFLRRVRLDITGELPDSTEIDEFIKDKSPDKRKRKIALLLSEPGFAALWTLKFCDILGASDFGVYADGLSKEQDAPRFQAWIRARMVENTPYDEFATRIITATSRDGQSLEKWSEEILALQSGYKSPRDDLKLYAARNSLDSYWQRKGATGVSGTLQIAHAFLGLRLECAQCHRHPHDVWQQDDLLSFANFFTRVRIVGFNGQNEKKYPEEAVYFKKFNDEGKKLADEAKKLKDGDGKKIADVAKKAQAELNKLRGELTRIEQKIEQSKSQEKPVDDSQLKAAEDARKKIDELQTTIDKNSELQGKIREMERRGKFLGGEVSKRILHTQVHWVADEKLYASVTSPLGKQDSHEFRLLGEKESLEFKAEEDPRQRVADWLRSPDNPFFAKAIVNRVWAHYFGRGIIDPPDDLSPLNPPSHPELLDYLCDSFIKNGYDLKWLHAEILTSRTYQQSSLGSAANAHDRNNYAKFYISRLPAEVILDMLNQATASPEKMDMKYYHWPDELKIVELPYAPRNKFVSYMLEQFGKPARNSSVQCDCERQTDSSMLQTLSLFNHPRVWEKIRSDTGTVATVGKMEVSTVEKIDELFMRVLSRRPLESERKACVAFVEKAESPEAALGDIMWALLNTKEFILRH
jgi:hypothetical protein